MASKVGKTLLLGPFFKIITNKLKNSITPILKSILGKVIGRLPEKYRGLAQKALDTLSQSTSQTNIQDKGSSAATAGTGDVSSAGTEPTGDDDTASASGEIFELYESESEGTDEITEIIEVERQLDEQIYSLAQNFENAQENLYYESEEPGLSEAALNEQFLDVEHGQEISAAENQQGEFTRLDNSRNEFVSGIANNTMEIQDLNQNFLPVIMAAMPAIKTVLKLTGGRQKIVDLISNMATGVLGNIIGKDQAGPLSRILVDQGLKILGLEIPEPPPKQHLGATVSSVITETADKVSQLPENILNGDEAILKSFVNEALLTSVANNFPPSVLNNSTNALRQLPTGMFWVSEKNGYYQRLNKEFQFVLKPEDAAKIYTRRGATLLDILCKYQGWDGKTPVSVKGYVFQSNPLTRLAMIARDYAGGDSSDKKNQILRLNSNAATMLFKEPALARPSSRIRRRSPRVRWYYIKIAGPNINQALQSTAKSPTPTPTVNTSIRSNDVQIKFMEGANSLNQLKVNIYLNKATLERIKSAPKSVQPAALYKELESILMQVGRKVVRDTLTKLIIPEFAKNEILSVIFRWLLEKIRSNLQLLIDGYITQSAKDELGVTFLIDFDLPGDFMKSLTSLSLANAGSFISNLSAIRPSARIKSIAGYKF